MRRAWLTAIGTAALCVSACGATAADAEQRLVTIATPSANVDPAGVSFNGADHPRELRANVVLPDGYDAGRAYPVLYLLHGVGDSYDHWRRPSNGDVLKTAAGFPGIIVMPEAARGFYTNWFNDGRRGDPGWERFYLDELVGLVERRFRIRPERRWHAIAGLSMGGFGATYLGGQLPGYFGSVASFSGFVQHQRPTVEAAFEAFAGVPYSRIFGPIDGFYATGHNPTRLAANLRHTRLFVAVGDGSSDPSAGSEPSAVGAGGLVETELRQQNDELAQAAREAGVDLTYRPQVGVHDWPYWRRHLRDAIAWDLFAPVAEGRPERWDYATVAPRGDMWGVRYAFAAPPGEVVRFAADGERLRATGSGTVTLTSASGCARTLTLPFDAALPAGRCPVRLSVTPARVRRGARTRFRFRATDPEGRPVAGALVKLGAARARTDAAGRATIRLRLVGRPGVRRPSAKAEGLQAGRARIRVR